ncbi:hypothetical protein ACQ4LE_003571 [Meloidogyne hapla]
MNHNDWIHNDVFLVLLFISYTLLSYISFCLELVKQQGKSEKQEEKHREKHEGKPEYQQNKQQNKQENGPEKQKEKHQNIQKQQEKHLLNNPKHLPNCSLP